MLEFYDWNTLLPEMTLAVMAMLGLLYGVFVQSRAFPKIAVLTLISFVLCGYLVWQVDAMHWAVRPDYVGIAFNQLFRTDGFAVFSKMLILLAAALSVILGYRFFVEKPEPAYEIFILMQLAVLGMMLMVSANNFLTLYVALELQSLALYVLVAMQRDSARAAEAGLKYFVLGALSSCLLLFGIAFIYGFSGTLDFVAIAGMVRADTVAGNLGLMTGLVLLVVGLAFKISAVPFHMWTPDVYEGAPTPITAFLSVAPKIAAMALIVRVIATPFGSSPDLWRDMLVVLAAASMLIGSIAALRQTNIKRLMAYSSIGHMGFILMGLAAGTSDGVAALLVYMAIYLVMSVGAFACILSMQRANQEVEKISDLSGIGKTHPLMALCWLLILFSMAGIPPLAGFFAKLYVITAAVNAGLVVLAVIGVLASVIAAYYYLSILKTIYFDEPQQPLDSYIAPEYRWLMGGMVALLLLFLLYPNGVLNLAGQAGFAMFATGG